MRTGPSSTFLEKKRDILIELFVRYTTLNYPNMESYVSVTERILGNFFPHNIPPFGSVFGK